MEKEEGEKRILRNRQRSVISFLSISFDIVLQRKSFIRENAK